MRARTAVSITISTLLCTYQWELRLLWAELKAHCYVPTNIARTAVSRTKSTNIVFDAIILSRITYGVCAWSGFLSAELIGRIDAFQRGMFEYGFCNRQLTFLDISGNCDSTLFKLMLNSNSCIYQLLPSAKNNIINLRPRSHRFTLPNCTSKLYKVSFINRCLFNYKQF